MRYQVALKSSAEKELDALPTVMRPRVTARLLAPEANPRPSGIKKLQGSECYRLRIGDYRVLHTVDGHTTVVMVFAIGHRREV